MATAHDVRSRIEGIAENIKIQYPPNITPFASENFFKFVYAVDLRVGEACGLSYPSDDVNHTGLYIKAEKTIFQPNIKKHAQVLALHGFLEIGRAYTLEEVMQKHSGQELAIFTITLEKRKGNVTRETALPLNQDYEPFTQPVFEYIVERQEKALEGTDEIHKRMEKQGIKRVKDFIRKHTDQYKKICDKYPPVFPWARQNIYPIAKQVFEGLLYPIEPYPVPDLDEKGERRYQEKNGKKLLLTDTIPTHMKPGSNHFLRHIRSTELADDYDIEGPRLDAYTGWVSSRSQGSGSGTQRRYAKRTWESYIAYLLVKRKI